MTKRKRYDDEFRASAVLMLEAAGYRVDPKGGAILYGFFVEGDKNPFYIGSTRYSLEKRVSGHKTQVDAGTHANKHFLNKWRKAGDKVYCIALATVGAAEQFYAERDLITWALDNGARLTNRVYNGLNFEIDERYIDPPPLTPDKFWMGYEMAYDDKSVARNASMQWILDKITELLRLHYEQMMTRFADDVAKDYGTYEQWKANRQTASLR